MSPKRFGWFRVICQLKSIVLPPSPVWGQNQSGNHSLLSSGDIHRCIEIGNGYIEQQKTGRHSIAGIRHCCSAVSLERTNQHLEAQAGRVRTSPGKRKLPASFCNFWSAFDQSSSELSAQRTCRVFCPAGPFFCSMIKKACRNSLSSSSSPRPTPFCCRPIWAPVIWIEPRCVPPLWNVH